MKSPLGQLRGRGFLRAEDIAAFAHLSTTDLIRQLESNDAVERSAAIRLLSQSGASVDQILAERLTRETKLYTKIELCEALQVGGEATARILIPLLGTVGRNQHKQPTEAAFKKPSYPLPRDVVARILARMNPAVLPALTAVIRDGPRIQAVEIIDAVGFMCFYSAVPTADRQAALRALIDRLNSSLDDELMQWKIVRALESFNHSSALLILREIIEKCPTSTLSQEAQRSLSIVGKQPAM